MIPRRTPLKRTKPFRPKRRTKRNVTGGLITFLDGREVCRDNAEGKRIYRQRVEAMAMRQHNRCCLCGLYMPEGDRTFEHERPRGMGGAFRDDRIEVDGVRTNGTAHSKCNFEKGSRRVKYLVQ
jgi:hypothetical protein